MAAGAQDERSRPRPLRAPRTSPTTRLAAAHRPAVHPLPRAPGPAARADLPRLGPQRRLAVPAARSDRQGIVHKGTTSTLLSWLVGGMIALSVINGVIGVAQTWISNQVGQRVMHDLRAAVYAHLQRMSLAFFTRTRSGEVQSRIAYDIGGIDDVVTSTATSTVSNVDDRHRDDRGDVRARLALTVFSLILLPFFVWLTRRVGNERRRIQSVRQSRLADMSTLVEESLSVSGILLGKTMGRSPELVEPLHRRVGRARRPRGARAHGRALADGLRADELRDHARRGLLVRRLQHRPRRQRDLDRHGRRVHDAADAPAVPDAVAAVGGPRSADLAGAVRAHLRVPRPAGRHRRAARRARAERRARRRAPGRRVVPLRARRAVDAARRSAPRSPPARARRWSARPARARPRSPISSRACTSPSAAA